MNNKQKQAHFLALYEPIHDKFERFCRAKAYGNVEYQDLINDTLLVAFEKLDTLKSEMAFLSFLFGISVRILSNKNKKIKEFSLAEATEYNLEDLNANTEQSTEVYFLYQALDRLTENQQEAIILFEISGFSIREIVEIQGASESAIKQRLKRGREKLFDMLNYKINKEKGGQ